MCEKRVCVDIRQRAETEEVEEEDDDDVGNSRAQHTLQTSGRTKGRQRERLSEEKRLATRFRSPLTLVVVVSCRRNPSPTAVQTHTDCNATCTSSPKIPVPRDSRTHSISRSVTCRSQAATFCALYSDSLRQRRRDRNAVWRKL